MHWHMDGGFFWAMWVGMALFWGSLIGFGVWVVRRFTGRSRSSSALRILEERFAQGEIDEKEFRARSSALRGR